MRTINALRNVPGQHKKEKKKAARKAANLQQKNLKAQQLVSGARTGKSKKKKERKLRKQLKEAEKQGLLQDVVMQDCQQQLKVGKKQKQQKIKKIAKNTATNLLGNKQKLKIEDKNEINISLDFANMTV
eukprot:TRINITY_DN9444_c0_g2_i2.p4 TRINITY_DN9444_c0_g2~~TRINITY_DN9444_c0_g2_i2.p4  ORF type:complete len:138 (-),score=31.30 TRINITY_DN9444_c0_g2_i2:977-1363(-)